MSDAARGPRCRVAVNRGARFCGLCQCPLSTGAAPAEAEVPATSAPPTAFDPATAWAPSGVSPTFHERPPEGVRAPSFPETPEGVVAALDAWTRSLSLVERLRLRRARPEAEVRAALAFFDEGRGPPPMLLAWFTWWDGQRDSGRWRPRAAVRAYSLAEAVQARASLVGLGAPWSTLRGWTNWLPLLDHSGDVTLFVLDHGRCGLVFVDHEVPGGVLDDWEVGGDGDSVTDCIADAIVAWRA